MAFVSLHLTRCKPLLITARLPDFFLDAIKDEQLLIYDEMDTACRDRSISTATANMVPTLFAMFEIRLHLINEAADGKCQAYFGA